MHHAPKSIMPTVWSSRLSPCVAVIRSNIFSECNVELPRNLQALTAASFRMGSNLRISDLFGERPVLDPKAAVRGAGADVVSCWTPSSSARPAALRAAF